MSTPRYRCERCQRKYDNYHDFNECCEGKEEYAKKVADNRLSVDKKKWFQNTKRKTDAKK